MNKEEEKFNIERYDLSIDKSLKAWSAADEFLLHFCSELDIKPEHLGIYNDRFGFLTCHLNKQSPITILTQKSQEKAISANLKANNIPLPKSAYPIEALDRKIDFALINVPKSLELFQLFLEHISQNSTEDISVACAFMTRNFSPKLISIAQEYFELTEQSKAKKKARLLILTKKRITEKKKIISSLNYNNQDYKQYWGVFSAQHIDYATQFFLRHLDIKNTDHKILDLASGNGIIGNEIFKKFPDAEIHFMDDSFLAVSSAQLNIQGENIHHHFNNDLSIFEDESFDVIVTNPPFHFEYEINIHIPIQLLHSCHRYLKKGGNLQIVSNKHLNYKAHLAPLFSAVEVIAQDNKFIVYKCIK